MSVSYFEVGFCCFKRTKVEYIPGTGEVIPLETTWYRGYPYLRYECSGYVSDGHYYYFFTTIYAQLAWLRLIAGGDSDALLYLNGDNTGLSATDFEIEAAVAIGSTPLNDTEEALLNFGNVADVDIAQGDPGEVAGIGDLNFIVDEMALKEGWIYYYNRVVLRLRSRHIATPGDISYDLIENYRYAHFNISVSPIENYLSYTPVAPVGVPTYTSMSPSSGTCGTLVTIVGTNFDGVDTIVLFTGANYQATILYGSDTEIRVLVPDIDDNPLLATGDIRIHNGFGHCHTGVFTFNPPGAIAPRSIQMVI